ncbi:CHAT domain protein [Psychroflexus torquis ATCC 700755]|uniref:CHAT domain protein n=1 Tax=Psychroflexus torquis (strain ATCC 700755 / CIP 106069 / ACAM 623) TaxID=313595 RepID=K4IEA3_PSYTT|nr:CHAT domain protein [Psychroflexus torquis ATCC 700755]
MLGKSKELSGYNATETAFKKLSGNSPSILHIATHGFFFPKLKEKPKKSELLGQKNSYRYQENPLLRSGLLFANANYSWQNGNNPYEEDDGILTALEISNLDLKNTDIVILSACETGLGDIAGSEGVYGLQRAFKMAGVKTIIMSLWEVPDAETAEFMNLFYSKWKKYNNPKKAFKESQQVMMNTYRDEPQKWASFVYFE